MAHWLFWQKKTTGAFVTEAQMKASLTSPWLVAPSPKNAMAASPSSPTAPSRWMPIAYPVACSAWLPITIVYKWKLCAVGSQPPWLTPRNSSSSFMAFPTYREHGVAWCRGLDPMKLLELFRGVSHGGWDPTAHNFHLYTIVIGSQALHATGYAMGIQRDGALGEDGE